MNVRHNDLTRLQFLLLPDGRRADKVRLAPLMAEMQRLQTPGILPTMSKPQVVECYERHVHAVIQDLRPINHRGKWQPTNPSHFLEAARFIERQAGADPARLEPKRAAWVDDAMQAVSHGGLEPEPNNCPPHRPIATTAV